MYIITSIYFWILSNLYLSFFMYFQANQLFAQDVLWSCQLAHRLGLPKLSEFLKVVIENVHCPAVLTEILHRCRAPLICNPQFPQQMTHREFRFQIINIWFLAAKLSIILLSAKPQTRPSCQSSSLRQQTGRLEKQNYQWKHLLGLRQRDEIVEVVALEPTKWRARPSRLDW